MQALIYTCCKETASCAKLGNQKKELIDLANALGYEIAGQISENLQSANSDVITYGMSELINHIENDGLDSIILDIQDFEHSKESIIKLCDACIRHQVTINHATDLRQTMVQTETMNLQLQ